ncbi:MAG: glycosyltransferase involved in cell wall biosynthesis [Saprospiraceae bacterium]|jgi:glycosyltransferase involved in cell wall biosynthesis
MKILQLTKKFPYPLKDGESIAVTNLSKSLVAHDCEMTLLSMNTSKHFVEIEQLPDTYNHYKSIHTVYLDNRVTAIGAFTNLFSPDSYHVSRFDYKEYREKLIELLKAEHFDIIQLETLYLAPYIETIKRYSKGKVVMRSHNAEFEIWNRIVDSTSLLPKRWYLKYLTKKLRKFELERLDHYDALVTVTQRDLKKYKSLGYKGKGMYSPIGININQYEPVENDLQRANLSFIGSLDWIPNLNGLFWFLKEIFPRILKEYPSLVMNIAGRNTPKPIVDLSSDNILIHGEVDSAIDFINDYPIMIVPLLSGSGMRVKILEGMALEKVVISTTIGAEGINAAHKESILIADTPAEFFECIKWLLDSPDQMTEVGKKARQFIGEYFDESNNAKKLVSFYNSILID